MSRGESLLRITAADRMTEFHLHLISDATGVTVEAVGRACLAQFRDVDPVEHMWSLVRSPGQVERVLDGIRANPGVVLFTVVDPEVRGRLQDVCRDLNIPCISVLEPVIGALTSFLQQESTGRPGSQHELDADYFKRIEAMEYTLGHDDGVSPAGLRNADIILIGVSRTSKTPTCIYLANRGVKVANVPFVPNCPLPPELLEEKGPLIVGLTKDPDRLLQVRRHRLRQISGSEADSDYVDEEKVREELKEARRFFARHGWPVLDVTRRSIEETAAEIYQMYLRRRSEQQNAEAAGLEAAG